MESEADDARTKLENFKYYTSLVLGTLCIVCIFTFLFLVPFVLDPAISTLIHEFVDTPVTCKVSSVNIQHGKSNCKWTSCREGCTAELYVCYQVRKRGDSPNRIKCETATVNCFCSSSTIETIAEVTILIV